MLTPAAPTGGLPAAAQVSQLRQWPVQLKLVNPDAGWLDNARLLICADCVPFALPDLHSRYMQGRVVINLCPKLDPYIDEYIDKLTRIFQTHEIESVLVLRMEVPCCGGAVEIVRRALAAAGKVIPLETVTIALDGSRL